MIGLLIASRFSIHYNSNKLIKFIRVMHQSLNYCKIWSSSGYYIRKSSLKVDFTCCYCVCWRYRMLLNAAVYVVHNILFIKSNFIYWWSECQTFADLDKVTLYCHVQLPTALTTQWSITSSYYSHEGQISCIEFCI